MLDRDRGSGSRHILSDYMEYLRAIIVTDQHQLLQQQQVKVWILRVVCSACINIARVLSSSFPLFFNLSLLSSRAPSTASTPGHSPWPVIQQTIRRRWLHNGSRFVSLLRVLRVIIIIARNRSIEYYPLPPTIYYYQYGISYSILRKSTLRAEYNAPELASRFIQSRTTVIHYHSSVPMYRIGKFVPVNGLVFVLLFWG